MAPSGRNEPKFCMWGSLGVYIDLPKLESLEVTDPYMQNLGSFRPLGAILGAPSHTKLDFAIPLFISFNCFQY